MAITLHYLSGSQYAWRVWLALEYKSIPYELVTMSFDAGDFKKPEFYALNPRRRVPVLIDDGFVLYESAAIVEYLEDKQPEEPRLFSRDIRNRAMQRRMVREADQYFGGALARLLDVVLFTPRKHWSQERIDTACAEIKQELAVWETIIRGDYLFGTLSAVDFTLYPQIALLQRIGQRNPTLWHGDMLGPTMSAWTQRMEALPCTQRTWPPHWRK